tara:strand:- start:13 stop:195 length:183 start_codon:yes stop_codon:yes gene_type:complete
MEGEYLMTRLAGWGFFLAGLGIFLHYAFAVGFDVVEFMNYLDMKNGYEEEIKKVIPSKKP